MLTVQKYLRARFYLSIPQCQIIRLPSASLWSDLEPCKQPASLCHSHNWQIEALPGCSSNRTIGLNPLHVRRTRPASLKKKLLQ